MSAENILTTETPEATVKLGRELGALLTAGDVILLSGDLGAGKTTFVQGLAGGAGYAGVVRSPSFVLINEYRGALKIAHCDLYRISPADLTELGLYDYLDDGVLVVEWHERARELAQLDALTLRLKFGQKPDDRTIALSAAGTRGNILKNALWAQSQQVSK